ncbi:MAG: tetratricopeptide repeat protein, partial [Candidatus Wallbacteria bacterium]|nr:tetratricopeptide repeat protein [Candidatus Wallbacteria bacterium]
MKTGLWFGLIISLISFSAVSAKSDNVPPHPDMLRQSSLSSSVIPEPPTPQIPDTPVPLQPQDVLPSLENLGSLIDISVYLLYFSNKTPVESMSDACGQAYTDLLDENQRASEKLAHMIAETVSEGADTPFLSYVRFYEAATTNRKSGLCNLAQFVKDDLQQQPGISQQHLTTAGSIATEASATEISLTGLEGVIQDLVNDLGNASVTYRHKAQYEYKETGDKEELNRKLSVFYRIFDIYGQLNQLFLSDTRATAAETYKKAEDARKSGQYSQAITLYKQVISMDAAYAAKNGCWCWIGYCYEMPGDYENALTSYRKSIDTDITDPYKRSSYTSLVGIFLNRLPCTETSLLRGIDTVTEIAACVSDEKILIQSRYDRGNLCDYLTSVSGLSVDKQEKYYLDAIGWYREYLTVYKDGYYLPEPDYVRYKICGLCDRIWSRLYSLAAQKRLDYCRAAISENLKYEEEFSAVNPGYAAQALHQAGSTCNSLITTYAFQSLLTLEEKK